MKQTGEQNCRSQKLHTGWEESLAGRGCPLRTGMNVRYFYIFFSHVAKGEQVARLKLEILLYCHDNK